MLFRSTGADDQKPRELVEQQPGSTVDLSHVAMAHADSAIYAAGSNNCFPNSDLPESLTVSDSDLAAQVTLCGVQTATFERTHMHDAANGLVLGQGDITVAYRGSFSNVTKPIAACNWGTGCSVDATNVDWGTSAGPFPAGGPAMVCGQVLVDPWVGKDSSSGGSMFQAQNCDGSATPETQLSQASAAYGQRVADDSIQCDNGFQDFCAALQTAQQCLGAANDLAAANSPFPVDTQGTASAVAGKVVEGGTIYLRSSSSAIIGDIGHVTGFALKALGVVSTVTSLAQAYNRCAP